MRKTFQKGFREGWKAPTPAGTRRTGLVLGAIVGWAVIGAAA